MAAASSEDENKPMALVRSPTEEYEGDEGESYQDEEEDDDDDFDHDLDDDFDVDDEDDDVDEGQDVDMDGDDGPGGAHGLADSDSVENAGLGVNGSRSGLGSRSGSGSGSGSGIMGGGPPLVAPIPQHNFAPPFYGRPPTPLPPSPSLTSLLRPSRPTTPDQTDDDLEPVPRAAPKVPTYEYYGFVLYLFSSLTFLMYLLWSYLPSPFLHALGIYYYPNRWWSLAIPSFLVMTLVYIYVALASYNTEILTLPLNSIETIVDEVAQMAAMDDRRLQGHQSGHDSRLGKNMNSDNDSANSDSAAWQHQQQQQQQQNHHQRQPSSPSPPLSGSSVWRHRSTANLGSSSGSRPRECWTESDVGGGGGGYDGGITMSGRRRNRSSNGEAQDSAKRAAPDWKSMWSIGTDAVMDIPLAGVCEVLYA